MTIISKKIIPLATLAFGTEFAVWGFISQNLLMMFIGAGTTLVAVAISAMVTTKPKKSLTQTNLQIGVIQTQPQEENKIEN
jgi:hypothetical protein